MITKLTLRNFKSVGEQVYEFTQFDLLVGRNNSGKSTVLQALAIWQFCVDEFHRSRRGGEKGIQVVLPNFTALPVPEFNLLWKDRDIRRSPSKSSNKKQEYILIEIIVEWSGPDGTSSSFGVALRYHSPQAIYAIPSDGWAAFRGFDQGVLLPRIAYVPPFSGLEPSEEWRDDGPLRRQVGKAQPGSVLRNLLYRVCPALEDVPGQEASRATSKLQQPPKEWREIEAVVKRWFGVQLRVPEYHKGVDTQIKVQYGQGDKDFDIIAGGSGFHQTLTLLGFLHGYKPTTILLDEPDAHLHVNLQREILDYFKQKSMELGTQFLVATHAEEFVRGVDASQIMSLLAQVPKRIQSTPEVLRAMSDVSNEEITKAMSYPFVLYVEGESDERILRAWAAQCGAQSPMDRVYFKTMDGGGKKNMKERADQHFAALQQIVPEVSRLMLFDFDDAKDAFHPQPNNPSLAEWKRKNIENYLLVADAWKRAALQQLGFAEDDLFAQPIQEFIDDFFAGENLTLPPGKTWRNVSANVFSVVDGKRLLFENDNSLFQQLRNAETPMLLLRERVAMSMTADEIHEDVHLFIGKLKALTGLH
ncbi:AAA family ATPase [Rhodoferax sp.]|uniref:ATP-dependent nuclease n=1 Tax=Rhodoferax sp. TaxID=50421 RepID=UPI00262A0CF2|nr:AAA family ATPase [Rhodoferax sp.]MDD5478312.1 AAA family ATPase [Rhodoferax sp.]